MKKLGSKKTAWSPAKLGANRIEHFFEDAALPTVAGAAFPVVVNAIGKQGNPDFSLIMSAIGTVAMLGFLDNKLPAIGSAISTIVLYAQRKLTAQPA